MKPCETREAKMLKAVVVAGEEEAEAVEAVVEA
jgi:hypothetical protein